ncbi:MAG TPA: DUF3147 family protein [Candidatus Acidoferrales bacterium]|nr:DUF3147 family protein [Candidatus Acidoferrales bacterium]
MRIFLNLAALKKAKFHEYAIRFLAGGIVTALTGIIAKKFGPGIGGLFLAFPAILPASVTLIEKHERQKKERAGLHGAIRGRKAAGIDAAGAATGSVGLFAFALAVWRLVPIYESWIVLGGATVIWMAVAYMLWRVRKAL